MPTDFSVPQSLDELRREIAIGTAEADRGELVDGREVFQRIRAKSASRKQEQA